MRFRTILTVLLCFPGAVVEAAGDDAWQPLLTAADFDQWTNAGASPAAYRLEGDTVIGKPIGNAPENAFLCSPGEYRDFELKFAFRITPTTLNSGVQFRSEVRTDGIVAGPQLEMEVTPPGDMSFFYRHIADRLVRFTDMPWRLQLWPAGGVYGESLDTGWIYPGVAGGDRAQFAAAGERLTRVHDWNELRLLARGDRVQTWLNGERRADYEHPPTNRAGRICLQVHGGTYDNPDDYEVRWRDLKIKTF